MRTTKTTPDRRALEIAYSRLKDQSMPLDAMLKNPAMKISLERAARTHQARLNRFDAKAARCGNDD
jgi:hypothetical protein